MTAKHKLHEPIEYDSARVIERKDGFYWQDKLNSKTHGPFLTQLEAALDMKEHEDNELDVPDADSGQENENGWIDPETGDFSENPTLRHPED